MLWLLINATKNGNILSCKHANSEDFAQNFAENAQTNAGYPVLKGACNKVSKIYDVRNLITL
jgi:hypothetical protein